MYDTNSIYWAKEITIGLYDGLLLLSIHNFSEKINGDNYKDGNKKSGDKGFTYNYTHSSKIEKSLYYW